MPLFPQNDRSKVWTHAPIGRRHALQAGAVGILGLGANHLAGLRAAKAADASSVSAGKSARARESSVIYIFLSGGLSQHDSFDPKPLAPDNIRGEFQPIATQTPGLSICEHLPKLAARSQLWSVVRSLAHPSNDHSAGHHIMLTGQSTIPRGFSSSAPTANDWPSLASVTQAVCASRNNLPPAVVLPERLIHYSGRVIPGQFAGIMGPQHDPWFIEASAYEPAAYGAFPQYEFDHQQRNYKPKRLAFEMPNLSLPRETPRQRLDQRLSLLRQIDEQRRDLDASASVGQYDRLTENAVSMLVDPKVRHAFDISDAPVEVLEKYGKHSFGWSLLMARRLVEAGVSLVQVNLGNNESWDTHGNAFPHLKDKLLPPLDQSLSALLDDLSQSGLLDSTLIVMAGEFGRTPKVTGLPQFYKFPGRDHWGAVQSVFFAGGGTRGGVVVGSTDKIGAYPAADPQTPETMAATIYHCLGLPETVAWYDDTDRPHHIYHGSPIAGLL